MNPFITSKGLILAVFALVSTLLISVTYQLSKGKIQQQQHQQLTRMLESVLPTDLYNNPLQQSCISYPASEPLVADEDLKIFIAKQDEQVVGAAIESVTPEGYSGDIHFLVGISGLDLVTGVRVLSHKETPGLGDKIDLRVSDWILAFENNSVDESTLPRWQVKKDGGQFDQFTGATITPRALVSAVRDTVRFYQRHYQRILNSPNACVLD